MVIQSASSGKSKVCKSKVKGKCVLVYTFKNFTHFAFK